MSAVAPRAPGALVIPSVVWLKLLQNAVAGLMVLTGRRAGMFARAGIAELAVAHLRECLAVARAEGAALGDEAPEEIVERFRAYPADMGTSILAGRDAGRPPEWDIRNGVVRRRGRAHGIPTPISDLLVPLLAAASDGPGRAAAGPSPLPGGRGSNLESLAITRSTALAIADDQRDERHPS